MSHTNDIFSPSDAISASSAALRPGSAGAVLARVVRVDRTESRALTPHGDEVRVVPTGGQSLAVGDWVWHVEGERPISVPRTSELTRWSNSAQSTQVVAANVDVVFLVVSAEEGERAHLIERLAALGWDSGARPHFVITKVDLVDAATLANVERAILRNAPGIEWTAVDGEPGLEAIRAQLPFGQTAVMLGHSGVGKSTLLNRLLGSNELLTGETRARDSKGRHTTTWRELVVLPGSGCVIDTPGVRELGVQTESSIDQVFTEIAAVAAQCRFADCTHAGEPGCAVQEHIADGSIDADRLDSFKHLQREAEHAERKAGPDRRDKSREYNRLSREYRRARGH